MDLKQTKREIQALLSANELPEVLKTLKALLPEESAKYQEVILLEGRLNEINLRRIRDLASNEELRLTYNNLRNDLLVLVNNLKPLDLDPAASSVSDTGQAKKGQVLYQIPGTMQWQKESKCIIRIALSDEIIIKNITLTAETRLKDIRVSDLMQVELLDTNESHPFSIRTISTKEQFIDKDDYTEWLFFVKPLKEGVFPITIKVAVIETIKGKEACREIVLEEKIEIVTTQPATDSEPVFKPAAYSFGFSSSSTLDAVAINYEPAKPKSQPFWRRPVALALAGLMAFSGVSYAAVPQEVEWLATHYVYNSENAYDNYIQRWEDSAKAKSRVEDAYFTKAEVSKDTLDFQTYIEKYPVEEKGAAMGKYTEQAYYQMAKIKQRPDAFEQYLDKFQKGEYHEEVLFTVAKLEDTPTAYKRYLDEYKGVGNNKYVAEVEQVVETKKDLFLEQIQRDSNRQELEALLDLNVFKQAPEKQEEAKELLKVLPVVKEKEASVKPEKELTIKEEEEIVPPVEAPAEVVNENLLPLKDSVQEAPKVVQTPEQEETIKDTPVEKEPVSTAIPKPKMVLVEGGTFTMGCEEGRDGDCNSYDPAHAVTVSSFYMGRYEVTVEDYLRFANNTNSYHPEWLEEGSIYNINTGTDNYYKESGASLENKKNPIVGVSWKNAVAYCNWLSEQHRYQKVYTISGTNVSANWNANGYRLPTEAEWEYAARGGKQTKGYKYAGGNDEGSVGWYSNNSGSKTHPVGGKQKNELGLYDMSGNVWEWCWDWYDSDYYRNSPNTNPKGPDTGSRRVLRGGSWNDLPALLRCSLRVNLSPGRRYDRYGFRLSRAAN